jgi:hypothetical protein
VTWTPKTPWGDSYILEDDVQTLSVSVKMPQKYNRALDMYLPHVTLDGATNIVTSTVPIPGAEPSLEPFLRVDGARPVTGDLTFNDGKGIRFFNVANTVATWVKNVAGRFVITDNASNEVVSVDPVSGRTDFGTDLYVHGSKVLVDGGGSPSDKRLKKDIAPIDSALEKIRAISGIYHKWNEESGRGGDTARHVGVIAQDVAAVMPELVSFNKQGYLQVDYAKMSALLVEGVKELDRKYESLSRLIGKDKVPLDTDVYMSVRDVYVADKGAWAGDMESKLVTVSEPPPPSDCADDRTGVARYISSTEEFYICTMSGWRKSPLADITEK